jgi:hypothetical protein
MKAPSQLLSILGCTHVVIQNSQILCYDPQRAARCKVYARTSRSAPTPSRASLPRCRLSVCLRSSGCADAMCAATASFAALFNQLNDPAVRVVRPSTYFQDDGCPESETGSQQGSSLHLNGIDLAHIFAVQTNIRLMTKHFQCSVHDWSSAKPRFHVAPGVAVGPKWRRSG